MANNRMYLRCRKCGRYFFLGKVYSEYFTDDVYYKHGLIHALNEFYDEHAFCDKEPITDDNFLDPKFEPCKPHYENQFELAYEFDYDYRDYETGEIRRET